MYWNFIYKRDIVYGIFLLGEAGMQFLCADKTRQEATSVDMAINISPHIVIVNTRHTCHKWQQACLCFGLGRIAAHRICNRCHVCDFLVQTNVWTSADTVQATSDIPEPGISCVDFLYGTGIAMQQMDVTGTFLTVKCSGCHVNQGAMLDQLISC